jgi:hypothetical protein
MYTCIYIYDMYVCMYLSIYIYMYVCIYLCAPVYPYIECSCARAVGGILGGLWACAAGWRRLGRGCGGGRDASDRS